MFGSNAWSAAATYQRPFCERCCRWSRVGRYIDTCRGCVCSLVAVCRLCAGWRQHADRAVPSLLLKPGNTPLPCPASEARAPVCPTWLTKKLWLSTGGHSVNGPALKAISVLSFAAVCWLPMDPFRLRQQYTIWTHHI